MQKSKQASFALVLLMSMVLSGMTARVKGDARRTLVKLGFSGALPGETGQTVVGNMVAIFLVIILAVAVIIPVTVNLVNNTSGLDSNTRTVLNLIPLILGVAVVVLILSGMIGGAT